VLSREQVALAALRILDDDGLEALSVERIARELGVRGPSIYHYFAGRSEILTEVARIVLGNLELRRDVDDWQDWMVGICLTFYRRVIEHPRSAVILVEHLPDIASIPAFGFATALLTRAGVDPTLQVIIIEGTEKLSWGWALTRAMEAMAGIDARPHDEQLLEEALRAFMDGVHLRDREGRAKPQ
jgi:TetR/AcrR family transcriptional regulator, tetracycline repressor protein